MDRLRREERADTGDPAVGIHRKRLSGEIVVAVEDGEAVVLAQGTHILVAVNVVRGILDGVDDINQIVHLLYVYNKVVTSENTRNTRLTELYDLLHTRMSMHKDYFAGNGLLTSTHEFFVKLTDSLMDSH